MWSKFASLGAGLSALLDFFYRRGWSVGSDTPPKAFIAAETPLRPRSASVITPTSRHNIGPVGQGDREYRDHGDVEPSHPLGSLSIVVLLSYRDRSVANAAGRP